MYGYKIWCEIELTCFSLEILCEVPPTHCLNAGRENFTTSGSTGFVTICHHGNGRAGAVVLDVVEDEVKGSLVETICHCQTNWSEDVTLDEVSNLDDWEIFHTDLFCCVDCNSVSVLAFQILLCET